VCLTHKKCRFLNLLILLFCNFASAKKVDVPGLDYAAVNPQYSVTIRDTPSFQIMNFFGQLSQRASPDDVWDAISHLRRNKDVLLSLDSGGGKNHSFDLLLGSIRGLSPGRRVISYVAPGAKCLSACLEFFLGADYRLAAPDAKFGFHAAADKSGQMMSTDFNFSLVKQVGASRLLLGALRKRNALDTFEITYFSGKEMYSLSSVDALVRVEDERDIEFNPLKLQLLRCGRALSNGLSREKINF